MVFNQNRNLRYVVIVSAVIYVTASTGLFASSCQLEEQCETTGTCSEFFEKAFPAPLGGGITIVIDDVVYVQLNDPGSIMSVEIIENGQVIASSTGCNGVTCEVSTDGLPSGTYDVKVVTESGTMYFETIVLE